MLVKNCSESVTDEEFDLASNWFNGTHVPIHDSLSNDEDLDASQFISIVSHSVSFSDPIVNDDSDNASSGFSEEDRTNISEEARTSVSEEGSSSVFEEALNQVGATVGIGAGAGICLGLIEAPVGISANIGTAIGSRRDVNQVGATMGTGAGVGTVLGTNHAITQVGTTAGAGAGVGTTLGANNDDTSNNDTLGSTQGSNHSTEELDLTIPMPIMANLDDISLRRSKRNKPDRKLQEQQDPKVKKFFGLLTMFYLFSATAVAGCDCSSPELVVRKIGLHAEKSICI